MNKVTEIGRLTRDPEVRYSQGETPTAIARYTLAVDRKYKRDGEQTADFIPCIAFGKSGEFAEKYLKKGTKIAVNGRLQSGSYEKDGQTHYTLDLVVEEHEFVESKNASTTNSPESSPNAQNDGFMAIPEGINDELPFA